MDADVIIVGAGIGGLQLAALLASDGSRVTVLEKLSRIGGRAVVWEKDGFQVDHGIHLIRFGSASATAKVFRHLGRDIEFRPLDRSYARLADGRVVTFPTDPKGFLTTRLMSKRERLAALSVIVRLRGLGAIARVTANLPLPRILRAFDAGRLLDTSVEAWLDDLGIRGGLRLYFLLVCASMQVCPNLARASAGELLFNIQSVLTKGISVTYPTRGWRQIFDTLQEVIELCGEIRTGTEVKRVIVEGNTARGVELTSGECLTAPTVVVSLPSQTLFDVLDEAQVPASFARTCKGQRPTSGVVLDYGLSRRICEDSGLWYLVEPLSFGMFTSNLCPDMAPPGKQLLTWLQPTELEEVTDKQGAKRAEERLEAALFRTFPGLEDAIEWRRAMHLEMVDGVEVNTAQHRHRRPGYRVPGINGLFLVGDTLAGGGAGGDVGHESVLECYRAMTGRPV